MSRERRVAWLLSLVFALASRGSPVRAQTPPPNAPPPAPTAPPAPPPDAPPTPPAPAAAPPAEGDEDGDEVPDEPAEPPVKPGEAPKREEPPADEGDEISDEELLAGEGNPGRPPPKGKGAVWGVVSDTEGPLIEAPVQVVGQKKLQAVTDLEGRYRLELPPGVYSLRFSYELHKSVRLDRVVVEAGKVVKLDAQLFTDEEAVDVVEVVEEADKGSLEGMTLSRQRASTIGDQIGRGEISKQPAANAAQAAQRVPGATIVGNRFVFVRGLGERYTNSLLNGAPLPSPEPDRAAIPLDVFPSLIIDSLTIVKTFTPDSPADFAGGSVRIQTRELPTKPLFQVSLGLGYNDHATFRDRIAQRGSGTDWLGYDDGTRDLPPVLDGKPLTRLNAAQTLEATQGINSYMSTIDSFTPPNHSVSVVAGDGWKLPGDQRLGALVTFNYGRSYSYRDDGIIRSYQQNLDLDGNTVIERETDYKLTYGNDKVNWGSLASVSYWPSANHRLTLLGIHTQLADSTAQVVQGFNAGRSTDIVNTRLRYQSRALNVGQLRGEHDFPSLLRARLEWNGSLSYASRSEPDTRDTVFQQDSSTREWLSLTTPDNGSHLNQEMGETSLWGGVDWTQPIADDPDATKLKVGAAVSSKSRKFVQRRFHLEYLGIPVSCGTTFETTCADRLFTPANIDSGQLVLVEDTSDEDAYKASLDVYAGYAMVDLDVVKDFRVVGGVRVEATDQVLDPYPQFPGGRNLPGSKIDEVDWLPALSFAYAPTKSTKARLAYGRTLARPQLRELASFPYAPFFGATPYAGNPELRITYINNYDTRFEFYPTLKEVVAFSFFYKTFIDPIENIVVDSGGGVIVPTNTPGAKLAGIELEARKSLEFVTDTLKDLTVIANLTLARSQIDLEQGGDNLATSRQRPMVNQAPYVINVALDYDNDSLGFGARALYNVNGARIVMVGTRGLPDAYEQPKHALDLTVSKDFGKHFQVKLNALNLLASETIVTLGKENRDDRVMRVHRVPQGLDEVFFEDARVFTLSGSYTY
jgi:outer membrane receptor protein involved in Fe transport